MNDENNEESSPDIQMNLAAPDQLAYDELVDEFGDELILADLNEVVTQRLRSLYDNQHQIRQRIAQAQERQ
jgi:dephospho-CoA kinase